MSKSKLKLGAQDLERTISFKNLGFQTTDDLKSSQSFPLPQDRAMSALKFGTILPGKNCNIFASGESGIGKQTLVRNYLVSSAKEKGPAPDLLYLYNFSDPDNPIAVAFPSGEGATFAREIDNFLGFLMRSLPKAFESKEYHERINYLQNEGDNETKKILEEIENSAQEKNLKIIQSLQGPVTVPIVDGKLVAPEELQNLSKEEQARIKKNQNDLKRELDSLTLKAEEIKQHQNEYSSIVDKELVNHKVQKKIRTLQEKYKLNKKVFDFLYDMHTEILENSSYYKQRDEDSSQFGTPFLGGGSVKSMEENLERYRVNLLVDNTKTTSAPIIEESNPTYQNLSGKIEYKEGGIHHVSTNLQHIKPGSLHKANGGYLIVSAYALLENPNSWQILKRCLKDGRLTIENPMSNLGISMHSINPEPMKIDVKVILLGDSNVYQLLYQYDREFPELFRVKADFSSSVDWNMANALGLAQFISSVCKEENFLPFSHEALTCIVQYAGRIAADQKKISTNLSKISFIAKQANQIAIESQSRKVTEKEIKLALRSDFYRSNLIEELIQSQIANGTIIIDTSGWRVGMLNGLSIADLLDYQFGRPSKISCCVYAGSDGIVSIDREADLSGKIHNKGSLIVGGYLGSKYGHDTPLRLSATIAFEQVYGEIDGDSASSTEIYVLLSSLSGQPLCQGIAVTGSVNQFGEIQAIGGVNEKIEGFFSVCLANGLTGEQGVIIPKANAANLMLKDEVISAVRDEKFSIYAIQTIDEGIEILTGKKAGTINEDGRYSRGSIHNLVHQRIKELAKIEEKRPARKKREES